ncbi:MAG: ATP-binding protein [Leptolyngbyaceae cyanobacterium SM2_3_12]|nr:ATP-binding protein [Leptolyngbyaceae cyanobacterium SM2_3_12]
MEGLGLALARRFSQLQGGELTFWPGFSHGPHITLLLPPAVPALEPGVEPGPTTALVLLACDRPPLIEQIHRGLQGSRYRLILARSTPDLMALWQRLSPSYVLLHPDSLPESLGAIPAPLLAAGSLTQILCLEDEPTAAPEGAIVRVGIDHISSQILKILDQLWPFSAISSAQAALGEMTLLLLHLPNNRATDRATDGAASAPSTTLSPVLRAWLQHYRCRLLQVDDLEQAKVLSRVWQPSAIILEGGLTPTFLQTLAQWPTLIKQRLIALGSPPEVEAVAAELGIVICPQVLQAPPHLGAMALIQAVRAEPPGAF